MKRFAMIDSDSVVVGVSVWDGVTQWTPPPGVASVVELQPGEVCGPGFTYRPFATPRWRPPEEEL